VSAEPQVQPFAAVKLARLVRVENRFRLAPLFVRPNGAPFYEASGFAGCDKGADHAAPAWGCECGFHAVAGTEELRRLGASTFTTALLDVELSGRVIEHEFGLRGEFQQVRRVRFAPRCHYCGGAASCVGSRAKGRPFGPSCDRCARTGRFSFAAVASDLGCPVSCDAPVGGRAAPLVEVRSFLVQAAPPVAIAAAGCAAASVGGVGAVASVAGLLAGGWLAPGRLLAARSLERVEISEQERLRVLGARGGLVLFATAASWVTASLFGATLSGLF
jgi:hypothetical protein